MLNFSSNFSNFSVQRNSPKSETLFSTGLVHNQSQICAGTGICSVFRQSLRNILHIERCPSSVIAQIEPQVPFCWHVNHLPFQHTNLKLHHRLHLSWFIVVAALCYQHSLSPAGCCPGTPIHHFEKATTAERATTSTETAAAIRKHD